MTMHFVFTQMSNSTATFEAKIPIAASDCRKGKRNSTNRSLPVKRKLSYPSELKWWTGKTNDEVIRHQGRTLNTEEMLIQHLQSDRLKTGKVDCCGDAMECEGSMRVLFHYRHDRPRRRKIVIKPCCELKLNRGWLPRKPSWSGGECCSMVSDSKTAILRFKGMNGLSNIQCDTFIRGLQFFTGYIPARYKRALRKNQAKFSLQLCGVLFLETLSFSPYYW